ncbi:DNA-binding response regulator [Actinobacteria bacterium YIM 96077]|uniref:HTH luxR-type domain-containing protein n=1 Tax=Phytoactinopolyspora halophila TaxID=1981511 RepID=A0A329QUV6_9ACTN|nr:DNA-binding response regulator [Actinobacteria bacterium YIM 96077]RAW15379.1 hypothetical protein DPM12_08995 [Phytoactinopolyspora halophila]
MVKLVVKINASCQRPCGKISTEGTRVRTVHPTSQFTSRELDILALLATGDSNAEIATKLYLSVDTIAYHVRAMLRRTGARNRVELATRSLAEGVLQASPWPPAVATRRPLKTNSDDSASG